MSDILISLLKITLTVTFLLMTVFIISISKLHSISNYLIYIFLLILFILLMREMLKKKEFYDDQLFNGATVVSMIYILIVMLRSLRDTYIITSTINEYKMTFFNNNSVLILIILIGLTIYNILLMIGDKKK
jgi:NADH:ubiquinone oxidoreductase subunit 2 (subunit N)